MPDVSAVAKTHVALQLALAGVHVEETHDPEQAARILFEMIDSDAEVVIVDESFRPHFSEATNDKLTRHRGRPLIVFCPSFDERDADVDAYLAAVLKPAVGYEIRL